MEMNRYKGLVFDGKVCDQLREPVPKPVAPLQPIVATKVFDHVMCDLISFPVPSFGFKYVLIFKDVFSGFIRSYKLRDKTSQGVLKCLEDLVCFLGPPRLLTSDNGGEFVSDSLIEACKMLEVSISVWNLSQGAHTYTFITPMIQISLLH